MIFVTISKQFRVSHAKYHRDIRWYSCYHGHSRRVVNPCALVRHDPGSKMILHFEVDMRGKLQGNGERKVQLNFQADSRDSPAFAETEPAIESAACLAARATVSQSTCEATATLELCEIFNYISRSHFYGDMRLLYRQNCILEVHQRHNN